jgi:hypothetical protein
MRIEYFPDKDLYAITRADLIDFPLNKISPTLPLEKAVPGAHPGTHEVFKGTPEWNAVQTRVQHTTPGAEIVQLVRIKNPWREVCYRHLLEELELKNGAPSQEIWGFHGTKDPNLLTVTDLSIDPRFSHDGAYGRGSYFAYSLDYSHRLNFTTPVYNGHVVLMFRVALGNCAFYEHYRHEKLAVPPADKKLSNMFNFAEPHYDTVCGLENHIGQTHKLGCDLNGTQFVIYDSRFANPEYKITYKMK